MTGIIVLTVIAAALITALELSHRRHADGLSLGPRGSWTTDDRDAARTKLDLLALAGRAEPHAHRPFTHRDHGLSLHEARRFTHNHGRHAA